MQRNLFDPKSREPFTVSRSGIDLFVQCPRCFYIDKRLGTGRPPGFPFSLNSAVDALLKKEFDTHRAAGTAHPLMKEYDIDAVPYAHKELDAWRDSLRRGIQFLHEPTNLLIRGGVDDVWVAPTGELIIVDYKATSKTEEVASRRRMAGVATSGRWKYTNGCSARTDSKFRRSVILCTATAMRMRRRSTRGWNSILK